MSLVREYIKSKGDAISLDTLAYLANLEIVSRVNPSVAKAVVNELRDQRSHLKMIASENFCSLSTQLAMGNLFSDKYAEGFAHHRFYAGCDNVDEVEALAAKFACELFNADHAYVQPHSGADANMIAYWAILSKRVQEMEPEAYANINDLSREDWNKLREVFGKQKLMGLNYYSGGHLTHGYRHNVSARMFDIVSYDVEVDSQVLDYDKLRAQALAEKPLILLAGYSAYPRKINFRILREIADEIGATFMVDMAHFAGLVAGKVFTGDFEPVAHAHVVTSTTHKTLRGPRGGIVLCCAEYAEWVDKGCPLVIGGPLPHVMAAKAIAFEEALKPEFKTYAARIVENSNALANALTKKGIKLTSGGTDNHLMVLDLQSFGITGRQGEDALRAAHITLNRNSIPFDPNGAWYTSGVRIGTPALTTLGMGVPEMLEIADIIYSILSSIKPAIVATGKNAGSLSKVKFEGDESVFESARARVKKLLDCFVLYPELDMSVLEKI